METVDQMPFFAEPLFIRMGANVEFHPVMNLEKFVDGRKPYKSIEKQRVPYNPHLIFECLLAG
jgi:hypothetical protein